MAHSPTMRPDPFEPPGSGAPSRPRASQVSTPNPAPVIPPKGNAPVESTELSLDLILHDIAERARQQTRATGAAIALERDGQMVCRATAGSTAPDLGARINTQSGLSGACVRMAETQWCSDTEADRRVDAEACRALGVRSIIVVPLFVHDKLAGVLEVFSSQKNAFGEADLKILQDLAQWVAEAMQGAASSVVRERALSVVSAQESSPTAAPVRQPDPAWTLPKRVPIRAPDARSRILKTALVVLTISLCSLLAFRWGWQRAHNDPSAVVPSSAPVQAQSPSQPRHTEQQISGMEDASSAPGAPATAPKHEKPAAGIARGGLSIYDKGNLVYQQDSPNATVAPLSPAQLKEVLSNSSATGSSAPGSPKTGAVPESAKSSDLLLDQTANLPVTSRPLAPMVDSASALDASTIAAPAASEPLRISQGVMGGRVLRRVEPKYPQQAINQRIEGSVTLEARIDKQGKVRDVKALRGNNYLSNAALDAIKRWRYQPYTLNGEPVEIRTEITINFALPK